MPHALRRLLALVLLLHLPTFAAEAAVAPLTDAKLHHETMRSAFAHEEVPVEGDHGHEDAIPPAGHQHGPQHQHGTAVDHCTHSHATGVAVAVVIPMALRAQPVLAVPYSRENPRGEPRDVFHPPRA